MQQGFGACRSVLIDSVVEDWPNRMPIFLDSSRSDRAGHRRLCEIRAQECSERVPVGIQQIAEQHADDDNVPENASTRRSMVTAVSGLFVRK